MQVQIYFVEERESMEHILKWSHDIENIGVDN